jgi:hypothetical protein
MDFPVVLTSGLPWDFEVILPSSEENFEGIEGENRKNFLVAVSGKNRGQSVEFLEKIMTAIGFDLHSDVLSIFLTPARRFSFHKIANMNTVNSILLFGVSTERAGLNLELELYKPVFVSGKIFLEVDELEKIRASPELKRRLWETLKQFFVKK